MKAVRLKNLFELARNVGIARHEAKSIMGHRRRRPPYGASLVLAGVFAASLLASAQSFAELPSIRLNRIQPLGAAAGAAVEVEVAAADAEDAKQLLFDHPGIRAELA